MTKKKGPPAKEFHHYLTEVSNAHVGQEDYMESPASAFLKYAVEAKSAVDLCIRKFPKKGNSEYTKDSHDSLQYLVVSVLPAIMGHFETYQRHLFAGIFDRTIYLKDFDTQKMVKRLESDHSISVSLAGLASFRGGNLSSIGIVAADNLFGWHDPEKVNEFFESFGLKRQVFSNSAIRKLRVLWQLRHSIVHTGGTLTLPDSQKVRELEEFGGKQIAFEHQFIYEVARKLHPIVDSATKNMKTEFMSHVKDDLPQVTQDEINKFFAVESSYRSWLSS